MKISVAVSVMSPAVVRSGSSNSLCVALVELVCNNDGLTAIVTTIVCPDLVMGAALPLNNSSSLGIIDSMSNLLPMAFGNLVDLCNVLVSVSLVSDGPLMAVLTSPMSSVVLCVILSMVGGLSGVTCAPEASSIGFGGGAILAACESILFVEPAVVFLSLNLSVAGTALIVLSKLSMLHTATAIDGAIDVVGNNVMLD